MLNENTITIDENIDRSAEFVEAFDLLEYTDDHLFLTGKAGTGKSTFLEYFRKNTSKNVVVLAPTGVSALNVKGQTIHSFFQFKPRLLTEENIGLKRNNRMYKKLKMIIIDEISMVRADIFDAIDKFLRLNGPIIGSPFGGVQICVIGDLYQLPPIVSRNESEVFASLYESPFFFSSKSYLDNDFSIIELQKIYRQSEIDFINALNNIRNGNTDYELIDFLNSRLRKYDEIKHKTPVVLTTTNYIADNINNRKLQQIDSKEFVYQGKADGSFAKGDDKLPAPRELKLKVGAQVMFTKNGPNKKWVNGTVGTVTELTEKKITVTVKNNGVEKVHKIPKESWETFKYQIDVNSNKIMEEKTGSYSQFPLVCAWAITIHKSQGKTLDSVIIDLGSGAFLAGQLYVALSRCKSFSSMVLHNPVSASDIICNQHVIEFSNGY